MAMTQKNMSSVRMVAQERLDLPDFNALQSMVDNAMQLQLGALMGRGGGLLGPVNIATSTDGANRFIEFTPFQYYWSQREPELTSEAQAIPYRGWRGGISQYNPTASGQATKVNYNDALATNVASIVWARPTEVATDTDARRKFTGGAETSISTQTRNTVVTQFKITPASTDPNSSANSGWAPVLYIGGWAANLPTNVSPISVWDSWSASAATGQGSTTLPPNQLTTLTPFMSATAAAEDSINSYTPGMSPDADIGLLKLLTIMRMRQVLNLSTVSAVAEDWYIDPPRGFKQLDADLTTAYTNIDNLLALLDSRPQAYASASAVYNTTTGEYEFAALTTARGNPVNVTAVTKIPASTGRPYITMPKPPVGYRISAVHAICKTMDRGIVLTALTNDDTFVYATFQIFACNSGNAANDGFDFVAHISKD